MTKKRAIIIDLDGTFINDSATKHMHYQENPDWDSVAGLTLEHPCNDWCKLIVESINKHGVDVIFLTGRRSGHEAITRQWLNLHLPKDFGDFTLLMRPDLDERNDTLVKTDIYYQQISPFYDVKFAIDDKKSIVDMWRNLGIPALHCDDFLL